MSAIKRGKIYSRERVNLGEMIPLKSPFSIQIDICSMCNLKCNFCFHSDLETIKNTGAEFGFMSYEMFTKIIDDIKDGWGKQKVKKLRLFKIGEPLLNPDVCKMVQYAKEAQIAECIEITTNGTLLNHKINVELVEAGLDILNISVNGINAKQYWDICNYHIKFEEYIQNITDFYQNKKSCRVFIKYSDVCCTKEEKECFYRLFEEICDEIFVEAISSTLWQNTNIHQKIVNKHIGTYGQELKKKMVCPFLFTTMVINDRGIVHLCCVDWKSEYILGDLTKESIIEIWNGERLYRYQKYHLNMQKDHIVICRNCESLSANTIDDIDSDADVILKRMKKWEREGENNDTLDDSNTNL